MTGSEAAAVTPRGVREGQPAALLGLIARRGPAVLAYCTEVCDPADVGTAAAEAFARFRAAVHESNDPAALNPEGLLLGATRHAAASMARTTPPATRRRFGARDVCPLVPTLLAARHSGALGQADRERLSRHLRRCEGCRSIEAAFERAERAYRHPARTEVPAPARTLILAAMRGAAPLGGERDDTPLALHLPPTPLDRAPVVEERLTPLDEAVGEEVDEELVEVDDGDLAALELFEEDEVADEDAIEALEDVDEDLDAVAVDHDAFEAAIEGFDDVLDEETELDQDVEAVAVEQEEELDEDSYALAIEALEKERRLMAEAEAVPAPRLRDRLAELPSTIVLPVIVLGAGVLVAMAAAGVFGGDEPTPETKRAAGSIRRIEAPVTTPLPVVVRMKRRAPRTKTAPAPTSTPATTAPVVPQSSSPAPAQTTNGQELEVDRTRTTQQTQDSQPDVYQPSTNPTP